MAKAAPFWISPLVFLAPIGVAMAVDFASGKFSSESLFNGYTFAATLTPFLATWVMPNALAVCLYPVAVYLALIPLGALGHYLPPPPPPLGADGEPIYMCGLPMFAQFMMGMMFVVLGMIGRAIGLSLRGVIQSSVGLYFIQLAPALCIMLAILPGVFR